MSIYQSYPHYEINVKDNSIYEATMQEILPVHRPLWIMKTQKGPVGEPVWCGNVQKFNNVYGSETLNPANTKYFSRQAYYVSQIISGSGAFVVRALDNDALYSVAILEAVVTGPRALVKYQTVDSETSKGETPASRIEDTRELIIDYNGLQDSNPNYGEPLIDYTTVEKQIKNTDQKIYTCFVPQYKVVRGYTIEYRLRQLTAIEIQKLSDDEETYNFLHDLKPSSETLITAYDVEQTDPATIGNIILSSNVPQRTYPVMSMQALYKGNYANDFGFRYFYQKNNNAPSTVAFYKSIFNSFACIQRDYTSSTSEFITDIYGRGNISFAEDPDCRDTNTSVRYDFDSVITRSFETDSNNYSSKFPYSVYNYETNLKDIGQMIINQKVKIKKSDNTIVQEYAETDESLALSDMGFVDRSSLNGYMMNLITAKNVSDVNYFSLHVQGVEKEFVALEENYLLIKTEGIIGTSATGTWMYDSDNKVWQQITDTAAKFQEDKYYYAKVVAAKDPETQKIVTPIPIDEGGLTVLPSAVNSEKGGIIPSSSVDLYLKYGRDTSEQDDVVTDNSVDRFAYRFYKLYVNADIVDKFRYPFTHIYDSGCSFQTKYAMIDFLTIRDDVMAELSTQVLVEALWTVKAGGTVAPVTINNMDTDIQNGIVLRDRALMTKESELHGTDCMRCAIYAQCGLPVSAKYKEVLPFTLWSAAKHSEYGSSTVMSVTEPRGLPNAYNLMFKNWNWIAHSELQKETVWNNGINYAQYADMTRIFYPSLRTVYDHDTSVLSDQWVVDCLVYTKHECRKAWAKFSGRNDSVAILQSAIKDYLTDRLSALYNGKYNFEVEVYQTQEEVNLGYVQHVKLSITFPATMRVLIFDIEVNRENFTSESEA